MVYIERCYEDLLAACEEIGYGELRPNELVPNNQKVGRGNLTNEQLRLLAACEEYGTPTSIQVVAKTPIFATFEIKTRAGPGSKTEKFN